jgi:hypothetical protein
LFEDGIMETLVLKDGNYSCFLAGIDSGVITAVFSFCEAEDGGYRRPQKLDGTWELGRKLYVSFPAPEGWELPPEGEPFKGYCLKGDVKFTSLEVRVSLRGNSYLLAGGIALSRLAIAKRERALAEVIDW